MTIKDWRGVMGYNEEEKVSPMMIIKAMEVLYGKGSNPKWTAEQGWWMDQHYIWDHSSRIYWHICHVFFTLENYNVLQ
jgi:hypothetical protein